MEENKNTIRPHIQVFGGEVDNNSNEPKKGENCRCGHRSNVIWGLIVLFAGIMLFLNGLGIVSWEAWNYIWLFWPALLVLLGLRIILGHSIVANFIIFIAGIAILGIVAVYALVHTDPNLVSFLPQGFVDCVKNLNLDYNYNIE
jgi:hypothetical protein